MYELRPVLSKQKSFYSKAMVAVDTGADTHYILRSYGTPVLAVEVAENGNIYISRLWSSYSATTGRHVREFTYQVCGYVLNKSEWDKMAVGYWYKLTEGGIIDFI
jgi:hypothetical protein